MNGKIQQSIEQEPHTIIYGNRFLDKWCFMCLD